MRRIPIPWTSPAEAILYISLVLAVIGAVNVFSASFVLAGKELHDSMFFIKRHLLYFATGMVGFISMARFNYRKLKPIVLPLAGLTIILLAAVAMAGVEANGARRWLRIAGIIFQPSELAKLASVIVTAAFLGAQVDRRSSITLFSPPLILAGIMGAFILKQPDMGTALVVVGLSLILYLIAGIPRVERLGLIVIAVGGVWVLSVMAPYRWERVISWLNPWAYELTWGYQAVQALLAIGSGGLTGTGLGMGASKFYYLPEAHTDFAFAVLAQELGFVGALSVIILFSLLGWYGSKIALQATDGFGQLLAAGVTALVVGQAVGNIAMVSGLLPVTGVPLPFISYGGTSLIINMVALGLLVGVGRQSPSKMTAELPREEGLAPTERIKARAQLRLIKNRTTDK